MALASANAVSPTPAASTAAGTNTAAALAGSGTAGTFIDSLEAALAPQSVSGDATTIDASQLMFGKAALSKLKSKLKGNDAALTLTPQQLQQQQPFLQKLQSGNSGINIPALRMAIAKGGDPSSQRGLPVVDPVTGKVEAAKTTVSSDPSTTPGADAASQMAALQQATNSAATVPAASAAAPAPGKEANAKSAQADPAKDAAHAASQTKLASALVKAAQAPVVKTAQDDGSKVPNAKIADSKTSAKSSSKPDDALTDPAEIQALGAKIAATAGTTHSPDTAHVAARNVALAEVAAQKTAATPTVTKLESAAMTNAAQVATHQTAPQEKVEAQALPVQVGAQPANAKDGDPSPQSGKDSAGDGKSGSQSANARTTADAQKAGDATPQQTFPANQQQPSAPAHTATTNTANVNTDAGSGNVAATVPAQPAHIAATLQVAQQQAQHDPAPDQTTFAALGVAIAARSKDGAKQFDINMHPADLGKIDVRISVDSDGQAQAHLTAEHPQTLQLLKQDQTTLAQNLRDAGLNLANNGLNFSLKGEQQSSTPTFTARSRALSIAAVQTPDIVSTSSSANVAPGDSRLDIRV